MKRHDGLLNISTKNPVQILNDIIIIIINYRISRQRFMCLIMNVVVSVSTQCHDKDRYLGPFSTNYLLYIVSVFINALCMFDADHDISLWVLLI